MPSLNRAVMALACALTISAAPALAQSLPEPLQVRPQIDERGVDLITQNVQLAGLGAVSIGPDGPGGLSFSRLYRTGGWRNSALASVSLSGTQALISIGDSADAFEVGGLGQCGSRSATYNSILGVGTTLQVTYERDCEPNPSVLVSVEYVYTNRAGVIYSFIDDYSGDMLGTSAPAFRPVSGIAFSTGEVITFTYKSTTFSGSSAVRLQAMTNNLGYALHFDYAINGTPTSAQFTQWRTLTKATAFDSTVVTTCPPTAETCTIPATWPSVTYTGTEFRVDTAVDALGRVTTFTHNASNMLTGVRLPGTMSPANDITYVYTAANALDYVTVNGAEWHYDVTNAGALRTLRVEGPLDNDRIVVSNQTTGLVTSDTFTSSNAPFVGNTTTYTHDTSGRVKRVIAQEGNYVEYDYDPRGNVTSVTTVGKAGTTPLTFATLATYPVTCTNQKTCNKPVTTTDALGRVSDYTYNATHGGVETVKAPPALSGGVRQRITYAYNQFAGVTGSIWRPVTVTTCATAEVCAGAATEAKTTINYSPGKVLPISTSSGNGAGSLTATTGFEYTSLGDVSAVDGPLSGTTDKSFFFYDILRRQFGVIGPDPDGSVTTLKRRALMTVFTPRGLPDIVTQGTVTGTTQSALNVMIGLQRQKNHFDTLGRPSAVQSQHVNGTVFTTEALVQLNYDASSRPLCIVTRLNGLNDTTTGDACTPRTPGLFGNDRIERTNYDTINRPVSVVRAFGTPAAITDAVTTYTSNGRVATVKDGNANTTTYEYDGFDRLKKTRLPVKGPPTGPSSTTDFEELFYDIGSRITSRQLRDGQTIIYAYDGRDRLTGVNLPGTADDITNVFDVMGRQTASGIPGQNQTFAWDMLGRLTSAVSPIDGVNKTVSYQWDLAGRNRRITYPTEGGVSLYVEYDYLLTGEMTEVRENSATVGTNVLAKYSYDNLGRRVSIARNNGTAMTTTYAYPSTDTRLSQLAHNLSGSANDLTLNFTWTPASQINTREAVQNAYSWTSHYAEDLTATLNGLNQVTQQQPAGGPVTAITYDNRGNLVTDGTNTFAYDPQNRLTSATVPSGTASLKYDALGRLHEVVKTGAPASTARFLYSGNEIIAEYDAAGLKTRFVRGQAPDEVLVEYQGGAPLTTKRWLIADERGSIVGAANASGASQYKNAYDEYGRPAPTNTGRFQYTGQMWLSEIGLYHYKARLYSPNLGRFLQTDPIGYADGLNLYAYVGGDPVNNVDPSGLFCIASRITDCAGNRRIDGGGAAGGSSGGSSGGGGGSGGGGATPPPPPDPCRDEPRDCVGVHAVRFNFSLDPNEFRNFLTLNGGRPNGVPLGNSEAGSGGQSNQPVIRPECFGGPGLPDGFTPLSGGSNPGDPSLMRGPDGQVFFTPSGFQRAQTSSFALIQSQGEVAFGLGLLSISADLFRLPTISRGFALGSAFVGGPAVFAGRNNPVGTPCPVG